MKLDCQYDYAFRRVQKIVSAWNGSAYVAQSTNRFVYDGWNLVAVVNENNALLYSFTWGLDASRTMQGAGGVRGLLAMTVHSGANGGTYFYAYDGNGNVAALVNATNGVIDAQYEYGPFGELLRASGPVALDNSFLFSTKFYDWETGFFYYGYRYYDPSTARWLGRDSIEESGGFNLCAFANNDGLNAIDYLGREPTPSALIIIGNPPSELKSGEGIIKTQGKTTYIYPGAKHPAPETATAAQKIVELIIPNPAETYRQADASFATAANPDLPKYLRVSAAITGTSIIMLGVTELVPGAGAGTKPLKRACVQQTEKELKEALEKEILWLVKERERHLATKSADNFVDLASPARRSHILDGEVRANGSFGGGHRAGTGFPGKSEFPASWSDDKIMQHISDVATDLGNVPALVEKRLVERFITRLWRT